MYMQVAVVGLGKMGTALAGRMLVEGFAVTVWARRASAAEPLVRSGATATTAIGGIWGNAEVAMSFLADDNAVQQVYLGPGGLIETAPSGALLIEMSTISPEVSGLVGAAAESHNLQYVRCPVSGNAGVLASGNATLIVSGDAASVEAARPVLEHVGPRLYYVGEREEARVIKLALNTMLAATAQMLAELITFCEASGVDRSVVLDVLGGSVIGSGFIKYKTEALLERRYDATFTTAMLVKDLRLAQVVAARGSVPLPVTDLVTELAIACCEEGLGDLDFLALLPHLQALAGMASDVPVPLLDPPPTG
jgi:3-hydroxyisobutyrate dehydrogenase-like beta-hydroxyacid dehydrogenase